VLASPPPPGPPHAPDGTGTTVFAISKLYLGDTRRDGTTDPNAWKLYGYNLDGLPQGSFQHCTLVEGASMFTLLEGPGNVENSFGHDVVPIFVAVSATFSTTINQALAAGDFTVLFSLSQLGAGSEYDPLSAQVAAGAPLGHAPLFDGTDVWPVLAGTEASFPEGYFVGDTWVSGPGQPIVVPLTEKGFTWRLDIHRPIVTMQLDAAHQKATGGILAGVIPTSALVQPLLDLASAAAMCGEGNNEIEGVVNAIEQASDILQDGTQDPTKACDAISIGLGFDALPVQLGPAVPPPPPYNPCTLLDGDAGAADAGAADAGAADAGTADAGTADGG